MADSLRHLTTPTPGKVVAVATLPACDFCGESARYDFATRHGPWANGCEQHWVEHRASPELGVGRAQRLITREEAT